MIHSLYHKNLLTLKLVPTIGNRTIARITAALPSFSEEVLNFQTIRPYLTPTQITAWKSVRDHNEVLQRFLEYCERNKITLTVKNDPDYPAELAGIFDAPMVLFLKGNIKNYEYNKSIAIVGTRRSTLYGAEQCRRYVKELVASGIGIISGFARGIDTLAHHHAVSKSPCFGVLGYGFDQMNTAPNKRLMDQVIDSGGAVITEYLPFEHAQAGTFPARNRIVAGLARSVLVIEASDESGSLITARLAFAEGRDVYAIPGDINRKQSAGCNLIIRENVAKLTADPCELVAAYGLAEEIGNVRTSEIDDFDNRLQSHLNLSDGQKTIMNTISEGFVTADGIAEKLALSIVEVQEVLTELELMGMVAPDVGKWYLRN